ncbi:ribonuclease H2 subunit C [Rhopalosiphum padi]|uniref:ribonuclease H2 subunit C n=1 Tax=Rhopalosiphum padi TaxID=40932 RepID=UPI00298E4415|nr:ribonuclease H2 subunit C [Rhopalosiphum padi]
MRFIINRPERVAEDIDANAVATDQQAIHLLPCKIHTRKPDDDRQTTTAPVDRYFSPYTKATTDDEAALWHASLRGKPLTGVKLSMPDGYVGVLCVSEEDDGSRNTVNDSTTAAVTGEITEQLMYWNWDRIPTREDPLLSALDWVRVSEAIMTNND